MIELTRLNGQLMVVNADLIKYAESSPDTMLTLINGEKLVVLEPCEEVVRRMAAYRAMLLTDVLKHLPEAAPTMAAAAVAADAGLRASMAAEVTAHNEIPIERADVAQQRRRREG